MPSKRDPAKQYQAAVALLAESAEQDAANELATILETAALAISLGLLPELSATCVSFWEERQKQAGHGSRTAKARTAKQDGQAQAKRKTRRSRSGKTPKPPTPRAR